MTDITIKQEKQEVKEPDRTDIAKTLEAADAYKKLKEQNDKLEAEYARQKELNAKIALGGKAEAGMHEKEKTQEDLDKEAAEKIINSLLK